jgi:hypothetical protein
MTSSHGFKARERNHLRRLLKARMADRAALTEKRNRDYNSVDSRAFEDLTAAELSTAARLKSLGGSITDLTLEPEPA